MLSKLKNLFKKKSKPKTFKTTNKVKRKFWYKEFKLITNGDLITPVKFLKSQKSLTKLKFGYYLNYFIEDNEIYIRVVATHRLLDFYGNLKYHYNSNEMKFFYDRSYNYKDKSDIKQITDKKLINQLKEVI